MAPSAILDQRCTPHWTGPDQLDWPGVLLCKHEYEYKYGHSYSYSYSCLHRTSSLVPVLWTKADQDHDAVVCLSNRWLYHGLDLPHTDVVNHVGSMTYQLVPQRKIVIKAHVSFEQLSPSWRTCHRRGVDSNKYIKFDHSSTRTLCSDTCSLNLSSVQSSSNMPVIWVLSFYSFTSPEILWDPCLSG